MQLCGGLPGFPVMIGGHLWGSSTTPLDCTDGTVLIHFLDGGTRDEIEKYVRHQPVSVTIPPVLVKERKESFTEITAAKFYEHPRRVYNSSFLMTPINFLLVPILLIFVKTSEYSK